MHKLNQEHYPIKGYFHFDYPIHISKVESYVQNRNAIAEHSFFPLISYNQKMEKHTTDVNKYTDGRPFYKNPRPIKYAGHLDGYIYKYYANELNFIYNKWVGEHKIDDCSVAYRTNKKGKSNIDFAAEVIAFLHQTNEAYVLVGDFKSYFESLNHQLLKERICKVHGCDRLSDDWFNVFNSVTKYGYIEKTIVEEFFGKENDLRQKSCKTFTSRNKSVSDFRKIYKIQSNKLGKGVPQGVPISAVMANIYAIGFDEAINRVVNKNGGLYRRYSDDFIIVIPKVAEEKEYTFKQFQSLIKKIISMQRKMNWKLPLRKHIFIKKKMIRYMN